MRRTNALLAMAGPTTQRTQTAISRVTEVRPRDHHTVASIDSPEDHDEIDTSLRAERVVRVLAQLKQWRGLPQAIRCDNGPKYTTQPVVDWCRDHGIELRYIQPGKPNQNAYIERFNKTHRTEVLDAHLFEDLDQVRAITDTWRQRHNHETSAPVAGEPAAQPLSRTMRAGILSL